MGVGSRLVFLCLQRPGVSPHEWDCWMVLWEPEVQALHWGCTFLSDWEVMRQPGGDWGFPLLLPTSAISLLSLRLNQIQTEESVVENRESLLAMWKRPIVHEDWDETLKLLVIMMLMVRMAMHVSDHVILNVCLIPRCCERVLENGPS